MLLEGKRALIAGVANKRSIAWGIAQALHAHGAQVAFSCIETNLKRVRRLAAEVNSDTIVTCDVRNDEEMAQAVSTIAESFDGKIDILVHSLAFADLDDLGGEFLRVSRSGWNLALEVSAYSLVALTRCARPFMQAAGGGSVITLSFIGSRTVAPGYNIMGVAKAALDACVRYLAYDLGPDRIRVNAIAAGPIRTLSSLAVENLESALKTTEEHAPLLLAVTLEDIGSCGVPCFRSLMRGHRRDPGRRFRDSRGSTCVAGSSTFAPGVECGHERFPQHPVLNYRSGLG